MRNEVDMALSLVLAVALSIIFTAFTLRQFVLDMCYMLAALSSHLL